MATGELLQSLHYTCLFVYQETFKGMKSNVLFTMGVQMHIGAIWNSGSFKKKQTQVECSYYIPRSMSTSDGAKLTGKH